MNITPDQFQEESLSFEKTNENTRRDHAVLGLCGEAGELASLIKRHDLDDPRKILDEAGDCLWYIALLLDSQGFAMSDAMEWVLVKLEHRSWGGKDKDYEYSLLKKFTENHGD